MGRIEVRTVWGGQGWSRRSGGRQGFDDRTDGTNGTYGSVECLGRGMARPGLLVFCDKILEQGGGGAWIAKEAFEDVEWSSLSFACVWQEFYGSSP